MTHPGDSKSSPEGIASGSGPVPKSREIRPAAPSGEHTLSGVFATKAAQWSFGRAVIAANRPDLCTFCLDPKDGPPGREAETNLPCHSGQHRWEASFDDAESASSI